MSLIEKLKDAGIHLRSYAPGSRRTTCPQCSPHRKKKTDPCMSVTIEAERDAAVWHCWHCGWKGGTSDADNYDRARRSGVPGATRDRREDLDALARQRRFSAVRR
jgi:twinkle protein